MNYKQFKTMGLAFMALFAATGCDDETTTPPDTTGTIYEKYTSNDVPHVRIEDRGQGTGTLTLSRDTIYVLDGFVFVNNGQELTIQDGTIIKGKPGAAENASALIVARGGMIDAVGTSTKPIIFTSEADGIVPADIAAGKLKATINPLSPLARGLWGGLIVLGKSSLNTTPSTKAIEGIPTTEPRGQFGGSVDNDNSGTLKYISIRHSGTNIGEGNEINGLTLGGVGSGTTVEYVEVIGGNDDGFEFFGGTVNTKYLVSAYCDDDAFDYDQGWRGKNQFWFGLQYSDAGDNGGEFDGGDDPNETGTPFATPKIYNATFVGNNNKRVIIFRANAAGEVYNSIFSTFKTGVQVELKTNLTAQHAYKNFVDGILKFESNIMHNVASESAAKQFFVDNKAASPADSTTATTALQTYFALKNVIENPLFTKYVPSAATSAGSATSPADAFFSTANFKGAFDPLAANKWIKSWTYLSAFNLGSSIE